MRIFITSFAALVLAACSQNAEAPGEQETAQSKPILVEPNGGIGDGAPSLPEQTGTIPERFRGVWDYENGACNPASDLRLDIEAGRITFYESVGEVTAIRSDPFDAVIIDLAMEGEGETWQQSTRLAFTNGGERLIVENAEKPDRAENLPRKRCSA